MSFESRKWVVMTLQDINAGDIYEDGELVGNTYIDHALESREGLRLSVDGTKTILKWDGETPEPFAGMTTYTHAEILEELSSAEWTSNEDPEQTAGLSESYVKYRAKSSAQKRLAEFPDSHGITALRSTKTFGGSAIILSNDSQKQFLYAEELENLKPVGDEEYVEWLARYEPAQVT